MQIKNYVINSVKCRRKFRDQVLWAFRIRTDSFWLQNQERLLASPSVWSQIQSLPFCFGLDHKEPTPANSISLLPCQLAPAMFHQWEATEKDWRTGGREEAGSLLSESHFSHLHNGKANSIYSTEFL